MESKLQGNAFCILTLSGSAGFFLKPHFTAAAFWTPGSEQVFHIHSYSRTIVLGHPNIKPSLCIFIIYPWVMGKLKFRKNRLQPCGKAVTDKTWNKKMCHSFFLPSITPLNFCPWLEKHFEEHKLVKLNTLVLYFVIPTMYLKYALMELNTI